MRTIEVGIEGTAPLMMHAIGELAMESMMKTSRKVTNILSNEDYAEDSAYRTEKGELYIPSRCMKACIVNASAWYKMGKRSAKQYVAGATIINPREILLGTKKYVIDLRPVVVQRARIIRARPRIDDWSCKFNINYHEQIFTETSMLQQIVEEGGMRVGLLDNRPHKGGENGMFKISSWSEK